MYKVCDSEVYFMSFVQRASLGFLGALLDSGHGDLDYAKMWDILMALSRGLLHPMLSDLSLP